MKEVTVFIYSNNSGFKLDCLFRKSESKLLKKQKEKVWLRLRGLDDDKKLKVKQQLDGISKQLDEVRKSITEVEKGGDQLQTCFSKIEWVYKMFCTKM